MDPADRECWTSGEEAQAAVAAFAATAFAAAGQAVTLRLVPPKKPPFWLRWLNAVLYRVTGTNPKDK